MTTPALRAAALGMARLYCNDARAERLAMFLEEHAQAAFVAFAPLIADVRAAERER